jgi:hypothetical protein
VSHFLDRPSLTFLFTLAVLFLSIRIGLWLRGSASQLDEKRNHDLGVIVAATLTLLGLVIGFSFSMAMTRYDLRKNLEEEETNAIGTEYLRVDVLPGDAPVRLKELLRKYLDERVAFYETRDADRQVKVRHDTAEVEEALWSALRPAVNAQPTPLSALALSGMNDVLNAQGYVVAAGRNRIPPAAWLMVMCIAVVASGLQSYQMESEKPRWGVLLMLPLVVALAFAFIADIDSARGGLIRVHPDNLIALARALHGQS